MTQSNANPTATGTSASFSLEDAVSRAIDQLPRLPGNDRQDRVTITRLEAEVGGIAGGRRLIVTVERNLGDV